MGSIRAIIAVAATAVFGGAAHAQSLIVVNSDGTGDFTSIQSAIDFASDGDVIRVVNSGDNYSSFSINNKSVVLAGDGFPGVSGATIRDLEASRSVALDGFDFSATVKVEDNLGPVWLEDIDVQTFGSIFGFPGSGLDILQNAAVSLTRVDVLGSPGMNISATDVFIYDSEIAGGNGPDGISFPDLTGGGGPCQVADGGDGEDGIVVGSASFLYLSNTTVRGGTGGGAGFCTIAICGPCPTCTFAGSGGLGIRVGADTRVEYLDSQILAGAGGSTVPECPFSGGGAGDTIVQFANGEDVELPGTSVSFEASNLNQVGDTVNIKFTGEPLGHLVYLQIATSQSPLYFPPWEGAWLIDQAAPFFYLGFIPASGTLELSPKFNPLGVPVLPIYAQGIFVDFPGGITARQISSPSLLIAYE